MDDLNKDTSVNELNWSLRVITKQNKRNKRNMWDYMKYYILREIEDDCMLKYKQIIVIILFRCLFFNVSIQLLLLLLLFFNQEMVTLQQLC